MSLRRPSSLLVVVGGITLVACAWLWLGRHPMTSYQFIEEVSAARQYAIYDADWSPEGDRIAMIGYRGDFGQQDVLIYDIASETVTRLLGREESFLANTVSWSPDGRYLAVDGGYSTDPARGGIWLVPVNGQPPVFLAEGLEASWSPGGDRIAIADETLLVGRLKILDLASHEETVVVELPYDGRVFPRMHPAWSPTSDDIAYTVEELTPDGEYRISSGYLLDLSELVPRRMSVVGTEIRMVTDLSWWPDGEWLIMTARADVEGVYLASSDGGCTRLLLPQDIGGLYVDASPEGDRLVLVSGGAAFLVDLQRAAEEGVVQFPFSCP